MTIQRIATAAKYSFLILSTVELLKKPEKQIIGKSRVLQQPVYSAS